jgi:hypothetical protein
MDSLKLTAPALRALAQGNGLAVSPASPLGAARADGGAATAPLAPELKEALAILAQPEALARLKVMVPGETEQGVVATLVRKGRATRLTLDGDTVEVTPAAGLDDVAASIAREVEHKGALAGQEVFLWPSAIKLMSLLWQDTQDPQQPIKRSDALERLKAGGPPEEIEKALSELVRVGLLQAQGEELRVSPPLQPWLSLVWSGHALQVEYLPLDPGTAFEKAVLEQGDRVLFLGPPGERILSIQVTGEALAQRTQGGNPVEDALVRLAAPRVELIEKALGLLFRLQPQPVA